MKISAQDVTGLVLAGGRATRMGGVDKGLQLFEGTALALHSLRRLRPQVSGVAVNANRNLAVYEAFDVPVWPDGLVDYPGPLAGFLSGLAHCRTPWLLTVPCDTPRFPQDLAERMVQALADSGDAEIAVAAAPEADRQGAIALRTQPVFCLLPAALLGSLSLFTAQGGRKIDAWTAQHRCVVVPFDRPGDATEAFANANTLAELKALETAGAPR
ncbi:molybdenum cofactor guanylyltransferase MobA [Variovorax sp. RHLX14]|uniref:molybdenum cofactor guanylyltransferase MobA n=1 Tax=Variovorax sp. RHLX14 TaxID=1259731 RepID=UPI003F48993C